MHIYGSRSQKKEKKKAKEQKQAFGSKSAPPNKSGKVFNLLFIEVWWKEEKNERKYILSKKYVKYTKQDKIKGKSRLEANQRFLTSLAKL